MKTVRAGGNGKNGYFRVADGFCVKCPQTIYGCISSRKCLKIGDITRHRGFLAANLRLTGKPFPCKQLFAFLNLFRDGLVPGCGKITGTARTAEDTASCIDQSVPVGAGKAAVKGNLINLVPVPGLHLVIERVVTLICPQNCIPPNYIYDSIAGGFMQTDVWLVLYSIFIAFSGIVYHRVFFVCNL